MGFGIFAFRNNRKVLMGPSISLVINKAFVLEDSDNCADCIISRFWFIKVLEYFFDKSSFDLPKHLHHFLFSSC
jgi:hypothetical protein